MKSKYAETRLKILHELYESGREGVKLEQLRKIAGSKHFDGLINSLSGGYINTEDNFLYTIKNAGRELYEELRKDELLENQTEFNRILMIFTIFVAMGTLIMALTSLVDLGLKLLTFNQNKYIGFGSFFLIGIGFIILWGWIIKTFLIKKEIF
ncbi:MAG: hypothetical protein PHF86_08240 [Candidatus Nanoarchaeia archaeon]|nr:hypothetical protein [Candidatus Nanoarchaeia archaeon]